MARRFNRNAKKQKFRFYNKKERNKYNMQQRTAHAKKHVINLSKRRLSNQEYILLAKGLKFIPTPSSKNAKMSILKDYNEFARKLRCRYMFSQEKTDLHPFRSNTGYKPASTCHTLENYIDLTKLELSFLPIERNVKNNLTKGERIALRNLKNDETIVIKKADKNSNCVILDRLDYITEVTRQLNTQHYCQLDSFNMAELKIQVIEYIKSLYDQGIIDKISFKFLTNGQKFRDARLGRIYILPKIHRLETETFKQIQHDGLNELNIIPPGRPIISQCGSVTELIGHYVDYFLIPIVQNQSTYIKDTTSFINIIEKLKPMANSLLVSYDITQMFTNLPQEALLGAVERAYDSFDKSNFKVNAPPVNVLIHLLRIILENNVFEFDGKIYKQVIGTAIGAVPSPEICDILMFEIMNQIISAFQYKDKIFYHGRYRDDGFIIYDGTSDEIIDFFRLANDYNPLLKFTYEIKNDKMSFLDVDVIKGQRFTTYGILDLEIHFKETNSYLFLHRNSCHSQHVFRGFIKGEAIRQIRNTSDHNKLINNLTNFKVKLLDRGYDNAEIDDSITDALSIDRTDLLQQNKSKEKQSIPLVLITKYNPYIRKIKKRIMKHWHLLQFDEDCVQIFNTAPIVAYSKHKSIGDMLSRSKLKNVT
ncbi:uncharacterized protein [Mytilus edulis]|uniref:uncharacterized protein n=1 Tax=Mytilus edulis TaxID=6550 RepID=UPI0039F12F03